MSRSRRTNAVALSRREHQNTAGLTLIWRSCRSSVSREVVNMATDATDEATDGTTKIKRSTTTYPYYGIEESLKVARAVAKLGTKDVRDEDIAKELDREPSSRFFSYYASSAREFGLISRTGRGEAMRTSLTDLGRRAITRVDDATTRATMMAVFLTPPLYKNIADAYAGMQLPDEQGLANLLNLQYGIVDGVKSAAAQAFIDSARFAGFLRDGCLDLGSVTQKPAAASAPAPARDQALSQSTGEQRSITLPSGAIITVSTSVGLMSLPKDERLLVLDLIDKLDEHQPSNGVRP